LFKTRFSQNEESQDLVIKEASMMTRTVRITTPAVGTILASLKLDTISWSYVKKKALLTFVFTAEQARGNRPLIRPSTVT